MVSFHPKNQKHHFIIGVTGIASGLGTTHFSIALSNYAASKKRQKTACLEFGNSGTYEQLRNYCIPAVFKAQYHPLCLEQTSAHRFFTIYGVDYYPNVTKEELPVLINSGYEILILDFGPLHTDFMDELYRCDRKYLLGSAARWRQSELSACIQTYPQIKKMESLFFMILYGTKSDLSETAKKLSAPRKKLYAIPFLPNPFHIPKEQFAFFEELL